MTAVVSMQRSAPSGGCVTQFRAGIEAFIAQGDALGAGKLMFRDMMTAMHTGRVAEWADAWVTDESVGETGEGMSFSCSVRGRTEFLLAYNRIMAMVYGCPGNTLMFKVEEAAQTGVRQTQMHVAIEIQTVFGTKTERHQSDIHFDDNMRFLHWRAIGLSSPISELHTDPSQCPPDDPVTATKIVFGSMLIAMHTGQLVEWADVWLTDESIGITEGTPYLERAKGKLEWMQSYNRVITKHYGCPENTMNFNVESLVQTGPRKVRICFTVTTHSPAGASVEHLQSDTTFGEQYQIELLHITARYNGFTSDAAIKPVIEGPPASSPLPPPTAPLSKKGPVHAQPPTSTRPCLHNTWDWVRTRKGFVLLRCRTCVAQWKLPSSEVQRCKKYFEDPKLCHLGTLCPQFHVNARKKTAEDKAGAAPGT